MSEEGKTPASSRGGPGMKSGRVLPLSGEWEDADRTELGCGRSAENQEFSGKAAE